MINKKISLTVALFAIIGIALIGTNTFVKALEVTHSETLRTQRQQISDKKTEFQQKLTVMKEARTARLEGKRLEICQKRQQKIGEIVAHGIEQNKKQLAVFKKIEDKVIKFYIDKKLSNDSYDAAVTKADTAYVSAVAAIEASSETTFTCTSTDGANPGSIIKEAMTTRHSAMIEYRTAIKELIQVVRKANGQNRTTDTNTKPTDTTEEQ